MLSRSALWLVLLGAFATLLLQQAMPAQAAFHCMRIAAVMGGANGSASIQYVELRMNLGGQNFLASHQIRFRDAAGNLAATFTFPDIGGPGVPEVPNSASGASILIATAEFAASATVAPDFIFSDGTVINPATSMTVPSNMTGTGDLKHPVLVGSGKVSFAEGSDNCQFGGPLVVDSVAYGSAYTGTVDYGSKFAGDLPTSGTQSLVVNNLNLEPANNATEYSLQTVPVSVPPGANTPRNNAGNTGSIPPSDSDGDGVPNASDNCPAWPNPSQALPPWSVPAGDPDCDGWTTADENFMGTNPNLACSTNRWPPDFNSDHDVNVFDLDILKPALFSTGPNPPYLVRLDLLPDNNINVFDLDRLKPFLFLGCTP